MSAETERDWRNAPPPAPLTIEKFEKGLRAMDRQMGIVSDDVWDEDDPAHPLNRVPHATEDQLNAAGIHVHRDKDGRPLQLVRVRRRPKDK